jgi:hypothetical protein
MAHGNGAPARRGNVLRGSRLNGSMAGQPAGLEAGDGQFDPPAGSILASASATLGGVGHCRWLPRQASPISISTGVRRCAGRAWAVRSCGCWPARPA